jgi:hypothetical protein
MRPKARRDASDRVRSGCGRRRLDPTNGRTIAMLWTILIILAIVALVLFILGRVRGGRGV